MKAFWYDDTHLKLTSLRLLLDKVVQLALKTTGKFLAYH